MPIILKQAEISYNDNGTYKGINTIAQRSTAQMISQVQATGAETIAEIERKIIDSQSAINNIEAQKNTMIASIASVAGQGTDTTLTQSGVAADAKVTGDEIRDLKSAIDSMQTTRIDAMETAYGYLMSNGTWGNVNTSYLHVSIPVAPGDNITLKANGNGSLFYGLLKTYSTPTAGATVDYSSATGFTSRQELSSNAQRTFSVPNDAYYFVVIVKNNSTNTIPSVLIVNTYNYAESLFNNLSSMETRLTSFINTEIEAVSGNIDYTFPVSGRKKYNGFMSAGGAWNNTVLGNYKFVLIKINGGESYSITTGAKSLFIGVLTNFTGVTDGSAIPFSVQTGWTARKELPANRTEASVLPTDGKYLLVEVKYSNEDRTPQTLIIDNIDYIKDIYGNLRNVYANNVNWCAMGDSITQGYVSYMNGSTPTASNQPSKAWAYKLSQLNKWEMTNIAIGGMGFLYGVAPGWQTARNTDFSNYNLVTIAYGVNDWKGNQVMGSIDDSTDVTMPTTVIQAMKIVIEKIISDNPTAKIIVILPLNCAGYKFNYGDEATNWGIGYEFSNSGTLEQFVQKMIDVCNYYGIQYIDMTHYSVVNRKNILQTLLDGVHPSEDTHTTLASELAAKITFK